MPEKAVPTCRPAPRSLLWLRQRVPAAAFLCQLKPELSGCCASLNIHDSRRPTSQAKRGTFLRNQASRADLRPHVGLLCPGGPCRHKATGASRWALTTRLPSVPFSVPDGAPLLLRLPSHRLFGSLVTKRAPSQLLHLVTCPTI